MEKTIPVDANTLTDLHERLQKVFGRHDGRQGDLVPILQEIQEEFGYIPPEAMRRTARFLSLSEAYVYGVATFYAQFSFTPQGKHKIKVCLGTACHVRGGTQILRTISKRLGIKPGETTPDYQFSMERVACFGSCALAPVVVINGKVHGRMTPQKAEALLEQLE